MCTVHKVNKIVSLYASVFCTLYTGDTMLPKNVWSLCFGAESGSYLRRAQYSISVKAHVSKFVSQCSMMKHKINACCHKHVEFLLSKNGNVIMYITNTTCNANRMRG